MDSSHNTQPTGTAIPTNAEQLRTVEALIAHYEQLLTEAREASRDWERIFDAIDDPICVVTSDYQLLHANAAYHRVFGYGPLRGSRHFCFSAHWDDGTEAGPCADCPLPATVRTRRAGFAQQAWQSPGEPGGEPEARIAQRWTYPIINADGTVDRVVEVIKDVTEQEQMRHTMAKTEALREADQLKAELLGTVSHELRSPLTAIKGYATTLLRHERRLPREERREFLEAIGEASDQLEVIINRLLEMSQLETRSLVPHFAPVDVAHVVREALAAAEQRARARDPGKYVFTLQLFSSTGIANHAIGMAPLMIDADIRLLRDALDNVLENAVKYSPQGGTIAVTLAVRAADSFPDAVVASGNREATARIEGTEGTSAQEAAEREPAEREVEELEAVGHVAGGGPTEMLEIVVRDTGLGIPAEHLGRVFERFHRVDTRLTREVAGLGLGLAMCKRIAELHGGTMWAESVPGEGSAFYLVLPLVTPYTTNQR